MKATCDVWMPQEWLATNQFREARSSLPNGMRVSKLQRLWQTADEGQSEWRDIPTFELLPEDWVKPVIAD